MESIVSSLASKILFALSICAYAGHGFEARAQNLLVPVIKGEKGAVVQIVASSGGKSSLGSGFWINENGYIATCLHVVNLDPTMTILVRSAVDSVIDLKTGDRVFANWIGYQAVMVAKDSDNDVAILQVSNNPFVNPPPATQLGNNVLSAHFQKAELEVELPLPGEMALIAGYPLGQPYLVFQEGTVASIAVFGKIPKILLSAVANHGNSGGPVFNDRGRVIGLLEGEIPGSERERTGIEFVVPAFFIGELMKSIQRPH